MLDEIKEEVKEFNMLIKKYPNVAEFYIGRAILYAKIKQYKKAVADYAKGHTFICYNIMAICKRNNLIKEFEEIMTRKINKDKNNIANYIGRARFYMSMCEYKKALADCETVLKISLKNKLIAELKKALVKNLKRQEILGKQNRTPKVFLA